MAQLHMANLLEEMQTRVKGAVIVPGDANYEEARQAWNMTVDQHPSVIVMAASAADVVEAVRFANVQNLSIAVQATGHGISRMADGALLINTANMTEVEVDAEKQTAWVEGGAKWGIVLEKAQAVGLAPLLGSTTDVGAVGYTLGGGMGWLVRKYGMSLDSVNAFEVVTADGQLRRASADENADLFWALRGGGGSFGVITAMEIRLYPVTNVFAGTMMYPAELAKDVFLRYREWIKDAPNELTTSIGIMNFPPLDMIPEFLRGKTVVIVRGCYCGPVEEGQQMVQQTWLDWQQPMVNMWQAMPFSMADMISQDPKDRMPDYSTAVWMNELTDDAIETIIKRALVSNGSPLLAVEIRHAGGAVAQVNKTANAYGNRDANHIVHMLSLVLSPEMGKQVAEYATMFKQELQPNLTGGVYMNFLGGQEKWDSTRKAYLPETYQRLMAIKSQYDPQNRFNHSFNIPAVKGNSN